MVSNETVEFTGEINVNDVQEDDSVTSWDIEININEDETSDNLALVTKAFVDISNVESIGLGSPNQDDAQANFDVNILADYDQIPSATIDAVDVGGVNFPYNQSGNVDEALGGLTETEPQSYVEGIDHTYDADIEISASNAAEANEDFDGKLADVEVTIIKRIP